MNIYIYIFNLHIRKLIKWRGSATKASLRGRRSRGARDTIFPSILVFGFFVIQKKILILIFGEFFLA
ncbi:hypothetical protein TSAR_008986 [Trichomalopsis sarcophagae]|uniref:Uncharacterized protein n=1 Tax=Trichomalopsis sarcophagae TaxID=543379 RepID=A0A232EQ14_9HYME|nr:hypothetical protein TSAR_008986 [Trichomalopsis sarcophagae]